MSCRPALLTSTSESLQFVTASIRCRTKLVFLCPASFSVLLVSGSLLVSSCFGASCRDLTPPQHSRDHLSLRDREVNMERLALQDSAKLAPPPLCRACHLACPIRLLTLGSPAKKRYRDSILSRTSSEERTMHQNGGSILYHVLPFKLPHLSLFSLSQPASVVARSLSSCVRPRSLRSWSLAHCLSLLALVPPAGI